MTRRNQDSKRSKRKDKTKTIKSSVGAEVGREGMLRAGSLLWLPAELAHIAVTLATALLFQRVFEDRSFFAPVAICALSVHIIAILGRRIRIIGFAQLVLSVVAVALCISVLFYRPSLAYSFLPTGATLDLVRADFELAKQLFNEQKAPVPVVRSLAVGAALAISLIALLSDVFAFKIGEPGQALISPIAIVSFVSLLGTQEQQVLSVIPLLIAIFAFLLLHAAASRALFSRWVHNKARNQAYIAMVIFGGLLAAIAVWTGTRYGPQLPGADAQPLIELGEEGRRDNKPLEVVSPLVEIQPRLLEQTNATIFEVTSDRRSYWRISSLDLFDGALWRSQGQFTKAQGKLDVTYPADIEQPVSQQRYSLVALNSVWAPASYLPTRIDIEGDIGINYEAESSTMIVDTKDADVSNGLNYTITSSVLNIDSQQLDSYANETQKSIDDRYLQLPDDFSDTVRAQSAEIVAGAGNRYRQALALQNFFRLNFVYDIDVARGHDITRIEDFLAARRGYCEQFAGSYAAMARSVGIPTRVAIGFTPGDVDPGNPNHFIVKGKHAHAWVEVYIDGAGWVAFDPTPGRGMPGAEQYTGNPEQQDSLTPPPPPEEPAPQQPTPEPPPEEQAAAEPPAAGQLPEPTPTPESPDSDIDSDPEPEEADVETETASRTLNLSILWALLLVLALIAYFVTVPALRRRHDLKAKAELEDNYRLRITRSWTQSVEAIEKQKIASQRDETISEYAQRVAQNIAQIGTEISELAALTTDAAYSHKTPELSAAITSEELWAQISSTLDYPNRYITMLSLLDPRPLWGWSSSTEKSAQILADGATSTPAPLPSTPEESS